MRLYGKNPVIERMRVRPDSVKKLYLRKRTELSSVVKEAKRAGIKFESVEDPFLRSICPGGNTQGVVAEVSDFEYSSFSDELCRCVDDNSTVLVFADGITDPQNLGGIVRNLACLGGFSLIIPKHDSVEINETVLRVASGGENYLPVSRVSNTVSALRKAKGRGVWVAGADITGRVDIRAARWKYPLAVVIGAEGRGIRPGVLKELDETICLPMAGAQLSYNVSVAAALFCYEINRSKTP